MEVCLNPDKHVRVNATFVFFILTYSLKIHVVVSGFNADLISYVILFWRSKRVRHF